jgi:hypothetical protein
MRLSMYVNIMVHVFMLSAIQYEYIQHIDIQDFNILRNE